MTFSSGQGTQRLPRSVPPDGHLNQDGCGDVERSVEVLGRLVADTDAQVVEMDHQFDDAATELLLERQDDSVEHHDRLGGIARRECLREFVAGSAEPGAQIGMSGGGFVSGALSHTAMDFAVYGIGVTEHRDEVAGRCGRLSGSRRGRQVALHRGGVSCGLGAVPAWKYDADVWFLQVSYDLDAMVAWRTGIESDGAVYAGVMALPSATTARKISADVPQLAVPRHILDRLDANPEAGVDLAVELVLDVRGANAFDGTHLIPVNQYRQVAAALEPELR